MTYKGVITYMWVLIIGFLIYSGHELLRSFEICILS